MHASVMQFLRTQISPEEIRGRELIEVGSQDVNGSPREVLASYGPKKYIGVDFAHAKGVDLVMDVRELSAYFGRDHFDVVISTEMLEHAQDWRVAVGQMKAVLKPGGLLVVTARGPGFPFHGYPHDYWRYTVQDFREIFADFDISLVSPDTDPGSPGVFLKATKRAGAAEVDLSAIHIRGVA